MGVGGEEGEDAGKRMKCLRRWERVPQLTPGQSIGGWVEKEGAGDGDEKGNSGGVERQYRNYNNKKGEIDKLYKIFF